MQSDTALKFAKELVENGELYNNNMRQVKWFMAHLAIQKHGYGTRAAVALQVSRMSLAHWAEDYTPTVEDLWLLRGAMK